MSTLLKLSRYDKFRAFFTLLSVFAFVAGITWWALGSIGNATVAVLVAIYLKEM